MERRRRIGRSEEIRRVRQRGRCWSSDVLLFCVLVSGRPDTRFAIVVSKRQGGAVVRNRIKRRLREIARGYLGSLPEGYDIVMIARGPIAARSYQQLAGTVADLLRRSRLPMAAPRGVGP